MVKIDELQQKKLDRMMETSMKEYKVDSLMRGGSIMMLILGSMAGWGFPFIIKTPVAITLLMFAINAMALGFMVPPYVLPSALGKYGVKAFGWLAMENLPVSKVQMAYYCLRKKWKVSVRCMVIAVLGQILLRILVGKGNLILGFLLAGFTYMFPLVDVVTVIFAKEKKVA